MRQIYQLKKQLLIALLAVIGIFIAIKVVGSTAKQTGPGYIGVGAESGSITSPMQVLTDAAASGGSYIEVASGNNSNASPPTTGVATYNFSVTASGTYKVWARVIALTTSDDSFWVRVDSGAWIRWNEVSPGSSWHWDEVHNSDAGNAVVTVNLAAGSHAFQDTFSVVEFNLWENCFGDGELISIKTSSSTIRYNTVLRSGGGFVSRAGNKSQIYGNFMLQEGRTGSGGIRIHEKDHQTSARTNSPARRSCGVRSPPPTLVRTLLKRPGATQEPLTFGQSFKSFITTP